MPNNFDFVKSGYVPDSYDFDFNAGYFIYNILSGLNKNFVAIWADLTVNINTGKIYVGTTGTNASFFVIDLKNKVLYDSYNLTKVGGFNESLDREDIVDINVGQ
jgi:hypothetical protein